MSKSFLTISVNFWISICLDDLEIASPYSFIFVSISSCSTVIFSFSDRAFKAKFLWTFFSAWGRVDSANDLTNSGVKVDFTSRPCWANLCAVCSILFLTSRSIIDFGISASNSFDNASINASILISFWVLSKLSFNCFSISTFNSFKDSLLPDCFAKSSLSSGNSFSFRSLRCTSKIASFPLESSWE